MKASDPGAIDALIARFGYSIIGMSALVMPGTTMPQALGDRQFRHIVEIGTCNGLTAAVLAEHADSVTTIDIVDRPIAEEVWEFFGVRNKIVRVVVKDDAGKDLIIRSLDFDMAYIDGGHSRYEVEFDFGITRKRCKTILFHDYPSWMDVVAQPACRYQYWDWPTAGVGDGVGFLLDVVRPDGAVERMEPFAWWREREA
jgi:predicted O-methyltransferase YrrM